MDAQKELIKKSTLSTNIAATLTEGILLASKIGQFSPFLSLNTSRGLIKNSAFDAGANFDLRITRGVAIDIAQQTKLKFTLSKGFIEQKKLPN